MIKTMSIALGAAAAALLAGSPLLSDGTAWAQEDFPTRPITLIVPWPAGGGSDISMRLLADAVSAQMGAEVVVVNRPGAGGALGRREIAQAAPDGYTIGMIGTGAVAAQYTNPESPSMDELLPIAYFGSDPGALTARADTGFENVADFVEAARANPGGINNGNDQPVGSSYITIAAIENVLGVEVNKVPYPGFAPTVTGLLSGEVDTATVPVPDVIEHHKQGTVRILGVADDQRHFLAPDVPTFKEQGFDLSIGSWRIVVAPAGIDEERAAYLEEQFLAALNDPEFQERARNAGFIVSPQGTEASLEVLARYDDLLYPILDAAGMVVTRQK